ncbi:MAG TPA: sigma-70 family RNA polymerase sigma factor [Longimicrobiales bacterium]|nr:sigma-70 family RNA polymerase sigma factor [Longimicrobiales bacterium]
MTEPTNESMSSTAATTPESRLDALLPFVYDELRAIAHLQLRRERQGHTLNTTALVSEAYMRLLDQHEVDWKNRSQLFALAARSMRRVLIDYARRHVAAKRGGGLTRVTLAEAIQVAATERTETLITIHDALERLATVNPRQARVVEYRFFGGMTEAEIAEALGVTTRTVRRDWLGAREWLLREVVL